MSTICLPYVQSGKPEVADYNSVALTLTAVLYNNWKMKLAYLLLSAWHHRQTSFITDPSGIIFDSFPFYSGAIIRWTLSHWGLFRVSHSFCHHKEQCRGQFELNVCMLLWAANKDCILYFPYNSDICMQMTLKLQKNIVLSIFWLLVMGLPNHSHTFQSPASIVPGTVFGKRLAEEWSFCLGALAVCSWTCKFSVSLHSLNWIEFLFFSKLWEKYRAGSPVMLPTFGANYSYRKGRRKGENTGPIGIGC